MAKRKSMATPQVAADRSDVGEGNNQPALIDVEMETDEEKGYKRRSMVWDHVTRLEFKGGVGEVEHAQCMYCKKKFPCNTKNDTTNMKKHLTERCNRAPEWLKRHVSKQKLLTSFNGLVSSIAYSSEACRAALAEMVILDELPFRFVEGEGFKKFCQFMQPKFTVPCRTTIAKDCMKVYNDVKPRVKSEIMGQRLCLTTDTWTSIQNINYMSLTAHYIDRDWNYHKKILKFNVIESHKGEAIGKAIEMALLEWGATSLFTVTVDNASFNNGTIAHLKKKTRGWKECILDHEFMHMRCAAHILNLVVCDGLKDSSESVEKIRNAIRYIRSSPSRLANFKKCVQHEKIESKKLLCLDVPTRWNSTYLMLETVVIFRKVFERLEEDDVAYNLYFAEDQDAAEIYEGAGSRSKRSKRLGPPEASDFEVAEILVTFLKLFYDATIRFSASTSVTLHSAFVDLAVIENKINLLSNSDDALLSGMAHNMKSKFRKYWGNIDMTNTLLYIGVVMDPRRKLRYVSICFGKLLSETECSNMLSNLKSAMTRLYEWFVKNWSNSNGEPSADNVERCVENDDVQVNYDFNFLEDEFMTEMIAESGGESKSELEQYLGDDCMGNKELDILNWWKLNSPRYPHLFEMARTVLAVPISTVASEACFSTGGRILDQFRSSLAPATVEGLVCSQNWLKNRATSSGSSSTAKHENDMECVATIEELGNDLTTNVNLE